MLLDDAQLLRYSRHILLPQIDIAGQLAICQARVLVVGLGGLGSPVALYLAAAGVAELVLADDDRVDISNLQRQIIHQQQSLGVSKVVSADNQLKALNSDVKTRLLDVRLAEQPLRDEVARVDVVVDCCDNFTTRSALNRACVEHRVPLVSGAAIRWEGQISVYDSRRPDSPCYACLYPNLTEEGLTCSQSGVVSPLVGIIGSYQALEVLKLIVGAGKNLCGRLQLFDGLGGIWRDFKLARDPACPVCGPLGEFNNKG